MMWYYNGDKRPDFAVPPGRGQESVWDYPRPPALEHDNRLIVVEHDDAELASSRRSIRILETAGAPTFYLPPDDVALDLLIEVSGESFCEWKGIASYLGLATSPEAGAVAWFYARPNRDYAEIEGHIGFYPNRLACFVDRERVVPQPGGFYGGWVTGEIVGPIKGEPGSEGW